MTLKEISLASSILLLKINVITGWKFPDKDEHQHILEDQFEKKLIESYPLINADEVEFAFRNYPVKDWGKNMNLNLVDEVMGPYLLERFEVSQVEDRLSLPQMEPPKDETVLSDDEWVEMTKKIYLSTKNYRLITQRVAAILFKQGKIVKPNEEDTKQLEAQATHDFHEEKRSDPYLNYGDTEREIKKIMNQILVALYFNENEKEN